MAKIFLNSARVGGRTATERGDTVSLFWVEGVEKEKEREPGAGDVTDMLPSNGLYRLIQLNMNKS